MSLKTLKTTDLTIGVASGVITSRKARVGSRLIVPGFGHFVHLDEIFVFEASCTQGPDD
jgi:hypothetical protein